MGRHDDMLAAAEQTAQTLLEATTRMTEVVAPLRGLSLNNVVRDELIILGATGHAHRNTSIVYAAVFAVAYDSDITLTSGPNADVAPNNGPGVAVVPGGKSLCWPLAGHELTIYGTPGARVLLVIFSVPQVPSYAAGGAIGGTP